jgi:pimeloyl-ACP methyl ester carboxylesterase
MKIRANGIDIEVEDTGADGSQAGRPVVLLIMGLGMQLVAWPPAMVAALVDAGYRVIRHDNRDIGLSQHFDHLGTPNVIWATVKLKLGLGLTPPYSLGDMAADAVGVLDALNVPAAHIIGVSMGGMIAQRVALAAPHKVLSLTSVMSSSGAANLPAAEPQVMRALFSRPAGKGMDDIVDHFVKLIKLIGSPGFPEDEARTRERILVGLKRNYHPAGTLRQMLAVGADTDHRAKALGRITAPTLVIHGKVDALVPFACGEDTARRIPGAKLVAVEGMGHDLPQGVVDQIVRHAIPHMKANAR